MVAVMYCLENKDKKCLYGFNTDSILKLCFPPEIGK